MSVVTVPDVVHHQTADIHGLKAKTVVSQVEFEATPKPPVADNFMYDFQYNHDLPTIGRFGVVDIPATYDARKEATGITSRLGEAMGNGDAPGFADLFLDFGKFA